MDPVIENVDVVAGVERDEEDHEVRNTARAEKEKSDEELDHVDVVADGKAKRVVKRGQNRVNEEEGKAESKPDH